MAILFLRRLDMLGSFSAIFYKGNNFCDFLYAFPKHQASSDPESALNGKNGEQILSF